MTGERWVRVGARLGGMLLVGAGIAVAVVLSRPPARAQPGPAASAPEGVETAPVEVAASRPVFVAHGVVTPTAQARLAFVEGGRVLRRPVAIGDRVEAGQVLAQLDPTPYRNAAQASAASRHELDLRAEQLARDRARAERLSRDGVATTVRLEQTESGHARTEAMRRAADAQLRESRRRVREATLRAPFAGVVTDVLVEPGELVAAGQVLVRIAGDGAREVRLEVPAEIAQAIALGDPVPLRAGGVEADDPRAAVDLRGEVSGLSRAATSLAGLYPVTVRLLDDARAGLGVTATLSGPSRDALRVPLRAVLDPSGRRPFVWAVVDGRVERRWLRLGPLDGDRVEVRDGLRPGDVIVVRGGTRLLEGDALHTTEERP